MADTKTQEREVLFALEGERKPRSLTVAAETTAQEFLASVTAQSGRVDLEIVLIEDDEIEIDGDHILIERILVDEFKLVHVATRGKIKVDVTFNGATKDHEFAPSATMDKIVGWAMHAFDLEGERSDFQLKLGDDLLPPGLHLGQIAEGKKTVRLALVMKIKPQGHAGEH